jgi:glycosyltransferase involved in cell wall biosynthesis
VNRDNNFIVGIDAANARTGGGVTYLIELLRAADPVSFGIKLVIIWGGEETLNLIDDRSWLEKRYPTELDKGIFNRSLWQFLSLSREAKSADCNVLLVPGGSYAGKFKPVVTMSRNLLPFELKELFRYGWSLRTLRFLILRLIQSRSFRKSDGVIFLTQYAASAVLKVTGKLRGQTRQIPHGLNDRFTKAPKEQHAISYYDNHNPYRILYVSNIELYKHQWNVVKAVANLRSLGLPVVLDLVGAAHPVSLDRLNKDLDRLDADRKWVNYKGPVRFNDLHEHYFRSDLGIFASSCENMPNSLLETMASGLPIACSNFGPMPEVLRNAGIFFNPEQTRSISIALRDLIESPQLRTNLSNTSYKLSKQYSWKICADDTFEFLAKIQKKSY